MATTTRRAGPPVAQDVDEASGQRDADADQATADADQTAADVDQTAADTDETAAERDDHDASDDQRSADRDQASADADHDNLGDATYETTRAQRSASRLDRIATHIARNGSTSSRDATAASRDRNGSSRDATAIRRAQREAFGTHVASDHELVLLAELASLRQQAAKDRARAAEFRKRAARERASSAAERARLHEALASAHFDDLTGALRRDMGWHALALEIDRSRRGDGRFVLAFVDVDGLKAVNDRAGHLAGDEILKATVATLRSSLRSFDPIVRYGGDEFVCGMSRIDVADVRRRFRTIGRSLRDDTGSGISVGIAVLVDGDELDDLVARADADLLDGRSSRSS